MLLQKALEGGEAAAAATPGATVLDQLVFAGDPPIDGLPDRAVADGAAVTDDHRATSVVSDGVRAGTSPRVGAFSSRQTAGTTWRR